LPVNFVIDASKSDFASFSGSWLVVDKKVMSKNQEDYYPAIAK
jgi:hypothetical protein